MTSNMMVKICFATNVVVVICLFIVFFVAANAKDEAKDWKKRAISAEQSVKGYENTIGKLWAESQQCKFGG